MTSTGHEEEFRRLFEEEARTRLADLAEAVLELELRGDDPELVVRMFRNAHTIKGGAGVVGLPAVADAVHELEHLLGELRDGRRPVTRELVDGVLGAVDGLRSMIVAALAGEDEAPALAAVRAALAAASVVPEGGEVAVAPAEPAEPARAVPGGEGSVPVPVTRLDEMVRLVGETAAAQLRVGRLLAERVGTDALALDEYRDLARALQELQEHAMRTRMVSVGTLAAPLRRAARDIARAAAKEIRWEVRGVDTGMDRHVLERLREPIVALVRNAVDHGIERRDERVAAGKDPAGTVRLHAMQVGPEVVVAVADDGRGIDLDAVRRAVGRPDLSDVDALDAIFDPGLTTARSLTGVSGRGVGLDAVRAAAEELRGRVEVSSSPGQGTEFRIRVPMTLALLRCILVAVGGERYALPLHATVRLLAPGADRGATAEGRPVVWLDGQALGVSHLGPVLGCREPPRDGPIVVVAASAGRAAFRVDRLLGQRDVVVKDLGGVLPRLPAVSGASIEPDGSIMVVLDPAGLVEAGASAHLAAEGGAAAQLPPAPRARVLVVDDAMTIRELQRSILQRAGYDVVTAPGGAEALALLAREDIDLVLTDIEMPGMDGFELTRRIRAGDASRQIPVLVLTSRGSEDDRRRGFEAGADSYLVKGAFDEHALLGAVGRLVGSPAEGAPSP